MLFLPFVALILSLKSQDKSETAFFYQKTDIISFDSCMRLFLLGISLSILLFITSWCYLYNS